MIEVVQNKFSELKRYRESSDISQSLLTSISKNPEAINFSRRDTNYFTLGSLVDTIAFFGEEGFNQVYHITEVKKPTDLMWDYHNILLEAIALGTEMEAAKELAYIQSGVKLSRNTIETRYKAEVIPYLEEELKYPGKILVQKKEVSHAKALVKILHQDKYCKKYFDEYNEFQVVVRGVLNNLPCKGLIDIVHIDRVNKTVRVVDLKTTSKPMHSFKKSIISYRYDLQLAFYSALLAQMPEYAGYKILNPRIVAINTSGLNTPIVFELSKEDWKIAENGGTAYDGTKIKGYNQLLEDYAYIMDTQEPYYKDYVDNDGVEHLNLYARNMGV